MISWFRELVAYRELLYIIVWRDIRIKYKQTVMGFLWALFMPMFIIAAGTMVRLAMSTISGKPLQAAEVVSVSIKAIPWAFLISSIRFGSNSLIANTSLITKIYFPKEILPISAVLSQLFDFFVASCILAVVLILFQIEIGIHVLWIPILFLLLVVLAMATGLILAAANLFFRDVKYIVEVLVNMAIFFTPVFYDADLAGRWKWILMINPVAPILEGLNSAVVLRTVPDIGWILYSTTVSFGMMVLAINLFKRLESRFAEYV